jgi:hypothetical protein
VPRVPGSSLALGLASLALLAAACGGKAPTAPAVTTRTITVSVAGNASMTMKEGDTRQLTATATRSDGATTDVTSTASWQSSATSIAAVSSFGMVTAVSEGNAEISATYDGARATLRADVQPGCTVSISPEFAFFPAFGGSGTVAVKVSSPTCRWAAFSDTSWFPFVFEPSQSGNGSFAFTLPPNSTPSKRSATIIVETSTAQRAALKMEEDPPLGCSYVTQPAEIVFTAAGGTGQFNVVTTPGDCRWTLVNGMSALGVSITQGFSGTGNGLVRYSVQAHTRTVDADGYLEIAGLSGQNPNGRHHVVVLKR